MSNQQQGSNTPKTPTSTETKPDNQQNQDNTKQGSDKPEQQK